MILALAALAQGFVVPNEKVLQDVKVETHKSAKSLVDKIFAKEDAFEHKLEAKFDQVFEYFGKKKSHCQHSAVDALDNALSSAKDAGIRATEFSHEGFVNAQSWIEAAKETKDNVQEDLTKKYEALLDEHHDHPPHHGPPHHGPPHEGPPHHGPPHHGSPHKKHSQKTIYQTIASSKYATKFTKLLDEFPDLVKALNGTAANYTVFVPTDHAFEKIPEHHHKPSQEIIRKVLQYHISPEFYPAGRVLVSRTIPTLLESPSLPKKLLQRLSTNISFKGLTVNFYSRIVGVDFFATNGVIHALDSIIIPPPEQLKIVELVPGVFSTFDLGLTKTGLIDELNSTSHKGGTLFAPSNSAFAALGPAVNAFLFSEYGLQYLKALLQYHVVYNETLYSDAYYKAESSSAVDTQDVPSGFTHYNFATELKDHSLSIDVGRYGRLIDIRINGFSHVAIADGVAKDGVVHVTADVLIPPKQAATGEMVHWDGVAELTVEDLIERLSPLTEFETKLDEVRVYTDALYT